tara:strand:+ start:1142 stop:1387 length:246 start_codon:yes stop_codon:yes gene_type:complete
MKIFLVFSIIILAIFFLVKNILYSAKKNLFKDQAAWSGNDIKIKYSTSIKNSESQRNDNYLNIIADESKFYLDDKSNQEAE